MKKLFVVSLLLVLSLVAFSRVTITMTAGAVGKELEVLYAQIDRFMKANPDIKVSVMPMPNSSTERHDLYVTYLAAGEKEPTVFMLDVIWPAEFAPFLEDLTADRSYFELDKFIPGTVKSGTVNGKIVAIPWFTDAGILYYRKDLLDKYGFKNPPKTWDELVKIAQTITAKEKNMYGFVWQGARYEGLVCDFMEFLISYGGDVIDDTGKVVINSKASVDALQFMVDLIYKYKVSPQAVTTYMEEEARISFLNGQAVFMRNWPYAWSTLNDPKESKVAGKVGVAPLPAGPAGRSAATLGGWMLGINKNATPEEKAAAKKLVKFLTSYDEQLYKAINAGQNPTMVDVYKDPELKKAAPFMVELYSMFVNAEPRPRTAKYSEISDVMQKYLHAALTQQMTAQQAIQDMAKDLNKVVAGR
ncbi:MAG TPA: ABC transporter substrate-binding protein [Fervidobacterium sp.]|nr:ABC transporter substrate-binding protein [Fervidobacterium sp.]HOK87768.1 ABC transporter substrate-binding protein [Fervidobacterium sp.]HOM74149.1 ABC transporter substrate-binding protein [Fervidobacterium sp.]HOQ38898.1 ABC transporter substrate-binding protein [Fervidobacterium sp.]HPP17801.1 ABC transporter substrate-binding protein [Fervidobacterium sp.]